VLALMLLSTVVAFARQARPDLPDQPGGGGFARLSLAALGGVFLVYVGGILVAGPGSLTRCLGWPMWRLIPGDLAGWPQIVRLASALVSALMIAAVVVQAWRTQRQQPALLRLATLVGLLFLVEMAAGVAMLAGGSNVFLLVLNVAAGTALWALLVVLAASAAFGPAGVPDSRPHVLSLRIEPGTTRH
jgi:heme a synthase